MGEVAVSPVEDGVVVVTLDRPGKKNALSIAVRDEMSDALDRLAADGAVRCVVITGSGDTFSAGFDLGEFTIENPEFQSRLWASSDRFHQAVLRFPLPTVAAVNGAALAGGFDLAVMCDLRVASATARFAHPERTFGDVVYGPLHDLVGGAAARELCLTGRVLDAAAALDLGLVMRVVDPADVLSTAQEVARDIAVVPRQFLSRTKAKIVARRSVGRDTATLDL
jgi:enoyl-CoA hydratase/carnithine racemase